MQLKQSALGQAIKLDFLFMIRKVGQPFLMPPFYPNS
jgi:hypothetical protein